MGGDGVARAVVVLTVLSAEVLTEMHENKKVSIIQYIFIHFVSSLEGFLESVQKKKQKDKHCQKEREKQNRKRKKGRTQGVGEINRKEEKRRKKCGSAAPRPAFLA